MAVLLAEPLVLDRDDCGDLIVPLRTVSGLPAVAILVRAAILLWRDEYYLNRDVGMPWLETEDGIVTEDDAILGQRFDAAKLERSVRGDVLKVTAVRTITDFKAAFDGAERAVSMSFTVHSDFGDQPIAVVVPTG